MDRLEDKPMFKFALKQFYNLLKFIRPALRFEYFNNPNKSKNNNGLFNILSKMKDNVTEKASGLFKGITDNPIMNQMKDTASGLMGNLAPDDNQSEQTSQEQEETQPQQEQEETQPQQEQEETQPVQEKTQPQPVQEETQPVQEETQPVQEETQPVQEETQPVQEETQPVQEENTR